MASETLSKQIDLAAQYQKDHKGEHGGIIHNIKEGLKEVVDKVTGKEESSSHVVAGQPIQRTEAVTKNTVKQFNDDQELRDHTFGASV